ncbi:Protein-L-isoaspartate O-methyltransferase [Nonomuraea coxensis DSM 45129]|uniref:Protein-L-isoaspartate O-methyltransferase n=1 Tax=Nonomuraea coxensis DSM 45129 TaxID=1122611 RepID=A0ABX8UDZ1_9ACTN|nr:methyltransferase domain-containing protein [Nonomuraea coxensis]QYC45024.1 Protein-L-isoaspartate O-methyltransferase [Nonomuraea coxensis DSM 45129]
MATATTISPAVQNALDQISETHYTMEDDGSLLPQTSDRGIIATMLDLLQVEPGQRVLEIGTGSGYSTALLSRLVGETGSVISVDIDPALTGRAGRRLRADGRTNVTLHATDGTTTGGGQVDRVIAWTSPERIPGAWTRHAAPGAIVVTPVQVTDLAKTVLVVRCRRGAQDPTLTTDRLLRAGFVEATPYVLDQWLVPPRDVDALVHDEDGRPRWLSATWLRNGGGDTGRRLLRQLRTDGRQAGGPLDRGEDPAGFYAFLLATRPDALTTAALGDPLWRIGASTPTGIALITPSDAERQTAAGDDSAIDLLAAWAAQWRTQGSPGLDRLSAVLHHVGDGWTVRLTPATGAHA